MILHKIEKPNFKISKPQWCNILLYLLTICWLSVDTVLISEGQIVTLTLTAIISLAVNILVFWQYPESRERTQVRLLCIALTAAPLIMLCFYTGGVYSPYTLLLLSYCAVRLVKTRHIIGQIILICMLIGSLIILFSIQAYSIIHNHTATYFIVNHIEAFVQIIRLDATTFLFTLLTGTAYIFINVYLAEKKSSTQTRDVDRNRILSNLNSIVMRVNPDMTLQTCCGDKAPFFYNTSVPWEQVCLRSHIHTDDRATLEKCMQNPVSPDRFRLRFMAASGNFRWIQCNILSRHKQDKSVEIMMTPSVHQSAYNDSSANQNVRADLLANMSHELRTPLNAVIGFSEILQSGIFGPLGSQKQTEYVQMIHDSGNHMLCLINELLDLAHIESLGGGANSNMTPVFNWVSVDKLLKECVQLTSHRMKPMGGRISFDALERKDFNLLSDRAGLKQIIRALLASALLRNGRVHNVDIRAERLRTTLKVTISTEACENEDAILKNSKNSLIYMSSLNMDVALKHAKLISGHIIVSEVSKDGKGYVILTIPHRRPSKFENRSGVQTKLPQHKVTTRHNHVS